ncbi:hypothetical protein V0288_13900 [Pannus brasiliensis CCIBt3594]|uniref:OB-fold nucleic acid binding domain protein n=1 Tax=Pannus brasiliensis CCIBt3594 TaxID=1427578 RepID=A0AAW9QXA7_9CHRO
MSLRTRLALVGGSFLLAGLFGCSTLADLGIAVPVIGDPPMTTIDRLPEKPKGALVYLRGVVGDQAPFLNGGAYLLKDGSGAIWIRTNTLKMPKKGEEIVVKGQIEFENVPKGVQAGNEVYVRELEQLDARAIAPSPTPTSEIQSQPQPSPVATREPEPKPSPVAVREPEPKPSPVAVREPEPKPSPVATREPEPKPSPVATREPEPKPSPVTTREPEPKPSPVATRELDEPNARVIRPIVEVMPPKPPAAAKPVIDPLDSFFLPHKQGRK